MSAVGFVTLISSPLVRVKSCFSHYHPMFNDMDNNKLIDKLVVQKLCEMHTAGDSAAKIGRFFNHPDRWALNNLRSVFIGIIFSNCHEQMRHEKEDD